MSDVRLFFRTTTEGELPFFDVAVDNGDLATRRDLETAVILSLFTDRRAEPEDRLPDPSEGRRGWWGDTFAPVQNDRIGSRLWLLHREKRTRETLARAREYVQEAVAWLVDDGIANRVETAVEYDPNRLDLIKIRIVVHRPQGLEEYRFDHLWQQLVGSPDPVNLETLPVEQSYLVTDDGDSLVTETGQYIVL
jgi:phage gp46-like protein